MPFRCFLLWWFSQTISSPFQKVSFLPSSLLQKQTETHKHTQKVVGVYTFERKWKKKKEMNKIAHWYSTESGAIKETQRSAKIQIKQTLARRRDSNRWPFDQMFIQESRVAPVRVTCSRRNSHKIIEFLRVPLFRVRDWVIGMSYSTWLVTSDRPHPSFPLHLYRTWETLFPSSC